MLVSQIGMHLANDFDVLYGGHGGFNMCNQAREITVAGFRQMRLVARPGHVALVTVAGFRIRRGDDLPFTRRYVVLIPPANSIVFDIKTVGATPCARFEPLLTRVNGQALGRRSSKSAANTHPHQAYSPVLLVLVYRLATDTA